MTVALGLVCSDGVIVASDSMGSSLMTAQQVVKVHTFERCPVIWTHAGSVYVMEEMQRVFEAEDGSGSADAPPKIYTDPKPVAIRDRLKKSMHKSMAESYRGALSSTALPDGSVHPDFASDFLLLGYANEQAWFFEFSSTGVLNWHTESGFYAIGSGGPFATVAHALMSHYVESTVSVAQGLLVAFRAISTTLSVSNGHVGPPVQIAVCDNSGARILDPAEIDEIDTAVRRWMTLERETLTQDPSAKASGATGDLPEMGDETSIPEASPSA